MTFKIVCMLIAAGLCIYSAYDENYKVSMYWAFVVAYWCSSIIGG